MKEISKLIRFDPNSSNTLSFYYVKPDYSVSITTDNYSLDYDLRNMDYRYVHYAGNEYSLEKGSGSELLAAFRSFNSTDTLSDTLKGVKIIPEEK